VQNGQLNSTSARDKLQQVFIFSMELWLFRCSAERSSLNDRRTGKSAVTFSGLASEIPHGVARWACFNQGVLSTLVKSVSLDFVPNLTWQSLETGALVSILDKI
jgi:hypothetical protein